MLLGQGGREKEGEEGGECASVNGGAKGIADYGVLKGLGSGNGDRELGSRKGEWEGCV